MGDISKGQNERLLYNIPNFLTPQDSDHIKEYIHHIEKDILELPEQVNPYYSGTTSRHGQYNFFEQVQQDLNIPLGEYVRDTIYEFFPEDTDEIWVKSWCNCLHTREEIPIHFHGFDIETDQEDFISGNIFLSNNNQPNPWYTHYETYGDIINEQGTLSIISSYQPHAVPPNHLEQNRYSCAFDVYMNNPPINTETDMYTHYVK